MIGTIPGGSKTCRYQQISPGNQRKQTKVSKLNEGKSLKILLAYVSELPKYSLCKFIPVMQFSSSFPKCPKSNSCIINMGATDHMVESSNLFSSHTAIPLQ